MIVETFPDDLVACICAHLPFDAMERLGATCRALRHSDAQYKLVALLQWGKAFWEAAFQRLTHHTYVGMRHELHRMHRHARLCDAHSLARWRAAEFYQFWEAEETYLKSRR